MYMNVINFYKTKPSQIYSTSVDIIIQPFNFSFLKYITYNAFFVLMIYLIKQYGKITKKS